MNTDGLTDEQMRKAIAEAMGFEHVQLGPWYGYVVNGVAKNVPSYLTDLNAMAEAEKTLTEEQKDQYAAELYGICVGGHGLMRGCVYEYDIFNVATATARQRAIAFLKTLP